MVAEVEDVFERVRVEFEGPWRVERDDELLNLDAAGRARVPVVLRDGDPRVVREGKERDCRPQGVHDWLEELRVLYGVEDVEVGESGEDEVGDYALGRVTRRPEGQRADE